MQSENRGMKNRISQNNQIVWLTAFILAVLVAATVSVVGTCIYNYAHRSDCQISLYDGQIKEASAPVKNAASQRTASANPVIKSEAARYSGAQASQELQKSAFEVKDAEQIWKTETAVELFETAYKNADGTVTVKSADGSKVIAPGTEGSYTFSLKNTSSAAADYKVWVEAKLSSNMTGVPIQTRMSGSNGWLLGGKNSWKQAEELDGVATAETIDAGKTAEYTIYWQWPFERGNDAEDTDYGNAAVNQEMNYTVTIYTLTASAAAGNTDQNGSKLPFHLPKTGDNAQIVLWAVVFVVSAGLIICLLVLKKRKNNRKNEQNASE